MAKSKLVKANEKIAEGVTGGFQKIEDGVVGGYKNNEDFKREVARAYMAGEKSTADIAAEYNASLHN